MRLILDLPGVLTKRGSNPVIDEIFDVCREFGDVEMVLSRSKNDSDRVLITDTQSAANEWRASGKTAVLVDMENGPVECVLSGLVDLLRKANKPIDQAVN